ncbi:AzlC family ABC transporter permease [Leptolyngbya sp. KIOST-1]|uniref:AzlC family ABC transporter permease n=1 Tax=Leptolyngbya sp. KIOST-1 TaxID=1229172 RepID=UPI00068F7DDA|nr:AzlC family ABC transporter permease [Leptolyngbya sp. KIOST-1]
MASSTESVERSPQQEVLAGARDIIPLVVGAIPFGIIFGTLAQGSGLSFGATLGMSAFVFAGSSQFIALGLLAAGSTLPLIVLTTVVVNLRHLLYAASLLPYVEGASQRWRAVIGFLLTDESFAIAIRRYAQPDRSPHKHWYYLGAAGAMYGNWILCTLLGLTVGQLIPNAAAWGLDFAMVATFIGMTAPYAKTRPMVGAIAVAGLVAVLANGLPHKLGLMVAAIAGVATGYWLETQLIPSPQGKR